MKAMFFALTAIGALAAAAPAVAQSNYGYGYQGNNDRYYNNYNSRSTASYDDETADANLSLDTRIGRLEARINAGVRAGTIDSGEAMRLRSELLDVPAVHRGREEKRLALGRKLPQDVAHVFYKAHVQHAVYFIEHHGIESAEVERFAGGSYGYGGVNSSERADLMERLRSVREDLRSAEGGSSYGYNDGYGGSYSGTTGSGAYGSTYSNGYGNGYSGSYSSGYGNGASTTYSNGYGSSYSNAYPSTGNGYYGRGGPEEDVDAYGSLRVGDPVSGSLYGVPYALRNTYRDGYNYYYRSDGRAIYQIDSRSNTVMRVFPVTR